MTRLLLLFSYIILQVLGWIHTFLKGFKKNPLSNFIEVIFVSCFYRLDLDFRFDGFGPI